MKKTLHFLTLLLLFSLSMVTAQAQGVAFSCDGTFYQIRQVGTGNSAYSAMYVVNRNTANYTTSAYTFGGTNATGNLGTVLNALGYNSQDGYMYAVTYPADNGTPNATTGIHLFRIGQGGIQDLGRTNLPLAQYNSGTFDKNGNYYLSTRNSTDATHRNTLFRLNLANFSTVLTTHDKLALVNGAGAAANDNYTDIGYNPSDNTLYSVALLGNVARIVISGSNAVVTPISSGSTSTEIFGSSFFDISGNMYAYSNGTIGTANSAGFYSVNTTTGVATLISNIDAANNSDGASCINPDQQLDVVKELVSVTPTGTAQQFNIRFAIRVKNTGTSTATNVQVTDFLWGSANNTTFPTASTVTLVANSASVTNYGANQAAAPALAFNSAYTGQGTNARLLTGNQRLTAGQSALIEFTVTVTFPANPGTPTTVSYNTAYASSTSSTSANQGHIQLSNGAIIPPGNLLAEDKSSNSAALPATANGDTPSATPIRFNTVIEGSIFEDANYGGGVGRSQAASNGLGVTGARIELYSVSGTNNPTYSYLTATTSDADGHYVFTTTNGTTALSPSTTYLVRVVNSSVSSNRTGNITSLVPVQTFRTDATTATTANVTNRVGGEQPIEADYGNRTSNLPTSVASATQEIQSLTTVLTPAAGPRVGIDFGFNFSTIVNSNNTGQGSLRQFIINSNALGNEAQLVQAGANTAGALPIGRETSIFMIPDGVAHNGQRSGLSSGLTNGVAIITATSNLPAISGANTRLDGSTQTFNIGNTNAPLLGTSTTVGTGATTFTQVPGPEVQLVVPTNILGLSITGADVALTGFALYGSNGNALTISGNNANISNNTLGTAARSAADPGNARTTNAQISITGGSGTTINNNLIAHAGQSGIVVTSNATVVTITGNEVRSNGRTSVTADGITIAAGGIVTSNLIVDNTGNGIDMLGSAGGLTVTGNTIRGNGRGLTTTAPAETAGVRVAGSANRLTENIIDSNYGAGIMVGNEASTTLISQNSILKNGTVTANTTNNTAASGQIGIDLLKVGDDMGMGSRPYVSLNTKNKTSGSGANGLLNFPVITQAVINNTTNGSLQITGFAPANSTIEFFLADRVETAFGQGQTYLFSAMEGGTLNGITDNDASFGSYSGVINGLDQGSETSAPHFFISIPLNSLSPAQKAAIIANNARLTATATTNSLTTSEFSGNVLIKQNAPLPVELVSFTVKAVGNSSQAKWLTASEKNSDYFVLERSFDAVTFAAVGQVKGQGTTSQSHNYALTDATVAAQAAGHTVYYRLRQVDLDGTVAYSSVQAVQFGVVTATLTLYPNPATTHTQLDLGALPLGAYQVTMLDMTGRQVRTATLTGGATHPLLVQDLPAGAYIVLVRGANASYTLRLTKN